MTVSTEEHYLRDLGYLLKATALEAAREATMERRMPDDVDQAYRAGRAFAYYEVISLMQQQAEAFGLSLEAMSLANVDPARDILAPGGH
jgi:hypothetical protein